MNQQHEKWLAQMRKGFIELCVLTALKQKGACYGLELLQLFEHVELSVNEGTLYPLLNRMQKNNLLSSYWEPPKDTGHPRRFYKLSAEGENALPLMLESYNHNHAALAQLKVLPS